MSVIMKVRNKDRLFASLKRSVPSIDQAVVAANIKSAHAIAAMQKSFAPVRTGNLRDSITVTLPGAVSPAYSQPGGSMRVPPGAVLITAGNTKVRYAHLVEYGTTIAPAQPYFWAGYRANRKGLRSRVSRAINKELRKI